MAERHAELPWKFSPWHIEEGPSAVRCSTGYLVCETAGDADAKLIVKAVNNHDALVKALMDALCELSACATQLGCREGGSVHRAQEAARRTLDAVGPLQHPEGK